MSATSQTVPRSEHPRPDMQREEWLNLNGKWEFAETDDDADMSWADSGKSYPDEIIVPFCRESKLSGLGRTGFIKNVWYRRQFERPRSWKSERTILHIGACDYVTTVWINDQLAGGSKGGQVPFSLDISSYLTDGKNKVVVHAFDDTRSGIQPLGKQCTELNSFGCLYTRTTGIWQTVWLEGVASTYIKNLSVDAPATGKLTVKPILSSAQESEIKVNLYDGKRLLVSRVVKGKGAERKIDIDVEKPKLWDVGKPNLYRVQLSVKANGKTDTVETYVGFRSIEIKGRAILLNGKPVFQRLILDQGFYPDGVWTAPTDDALRKDIELSMAAGFNGARLHEKVFEPRFLYWADKLGYLVWGEFPNWGLNYTDQRIVEPVTEEWKAILARDRNHPSIIGWCPFNETPTEAGPLQNSIVAWTRQADPSRPIIDTSGYVHSVENPLVLDAHDYNQDPSSFKKKWDSYFSANALPSRYRGYEVAEVPFMVSEYGGIGWDSAGGWGYGEGPKSLEEFYVRFKGLTDALLDNPNMFGFCYTQLTDVEQEKNGVYRYDRTSKFDVPRLKKVLTRRAAIEKGINPTKAEPPVKWNVLVGSARDSGTTLWRMTMDSPAENWMTGAFSDSEWQSAAGGFGDKGGFERDIKTKWNTPDIWLRNEFEWSGSEINEAILAIHYDNQATVYVNGALVWQAEPKSWNDGYERVALTSAFRKALKRGKNVIAVHCHQDTGGQYIDLAVLVR